MKSFKNCESAGLRAFEAGDILRNGIPNSNWILADEVEAKIAALDFEKELLWLKIDHLVSDIAETKRLINKWSLEETMKLIEQGQKNIRENVSNLVKKNFGDPEIAARKG